MAQTNLNIHSYLFSPTLSVRITKHTSYKNVYIIKKEKKNVFTFNTSFKISSEYLTDNSLVQAKPHNQVNSKSAIVKYGLMQNQVHLFFHLWFFSPKNLIERIIITNFIYLNSASFHPSKVRNCTSWFLHYIRPP